MKRPPLTHAERKVRDELRAIRARGRRRYYISFSTKGSEYIDARGRLRWRKSVWPILFQSRADAERAMELLPIFKNGDAIPGVRGRLVSASVEITKQRS